MIAIFPGSFDPITLGHEDIINRASKLFDHLVIAVGINDTKKYFLNIDERIYLIKTVCSKLKNTEVVSYQDLTVNFALKIKADIIIRSIRNSIDFDYENQQAKMNNDLNPDIETIFLAPSSKYQHISSTLVKQVNDFKGNISPFVSKSVESYLLKK